MAKKVAILFIFFLCCQHSYGQAAASDSSKTRTEIPSEPKKKEVLNTNESIKYIGSKLWFQMKKRLNLTTKEEEEAELKKAKKVNLSFGSVVIEG